MEKICIICKKPFTPAPRHETVQRTCSEECRRIYNNEYAKAKQRDPAIKARKRKQYYDTHKTYCQLCGEVVEHDLTARSNAPTARMHDECVYEDCRRTLMCGKKLNHAQQLRLMYRGYSITDFKDECVTWRNKNMPMSACDDSMLIYVPQQYMLAVDRIALNVETGMYELDVRTDFQNGNFVVERHTFTRLRDIRRFFSSLRKNLKLSSNF